MQLVMNFLLKPFSKVECGNVHVHFQHLEIVGKAF